VTGIVATLVTLFSMLDWAVCEGDGAIGRATAYLPHK